MIRVVLYSDQPILARCWVATAAGIAAPVCRSMTETGLLFDAFAIAKRVGLMETPPPPAKRLTSLPKVILPRRGTAAGRSRSNARSKAHAVTVTDGRAAAMPSEGASFLQTSGDQLCGRSTMKR